MDFFDEIWLAKKFHIYLCSLEVEYWNWIPKSRFILFARSFVIIIRIRRLGQANRRLDHM